MVCFLSNLMLSFGLKHPHPPLAICISTITTWTVKIRIHFQHLGSFQNLGSNHNLRFRHTRAFWMRQTISRIPQCCFTDKDMRTETNKWKNKSEDTFKYPKVLMCLEKLDSTSICICQAFSNLDAIKLRLKSGESVDRSRHIRWASCTGKWTTFGKVLLGLLSNMEVVGSRSTTRSRGRSSQLFFPGISQVK